MYESPKECMSIQIFDIHIFYIIFYCFETYKTCHIVEDIYHVK